MLYRDSPTVSKQRKNFVGDKRICSGLGCSNEVTITERMAQSRNYRCVDCKRRSSKESARRREVGRIK